ncbi:MAG: sialate O-acetylesterase [Verrucomicrobia bacterium]|nr:sialate O-acetylesterase [Verrucomicrobiota bacterium]
MFTSLIRMAIPVVVLAVGLQPASAEIRLPRLLNDNMVLQREMPIPVWGWAKPNEQVTVRLGKSSASATTDANGQWSVKLPKMKAGGPYQLTVAGANTLTLSNVMIGEVWVCSGQSNAGKPIGIHPGQQPCLNYEKEIAAADYPQIRLMEVPPESAQTPVADIAGAQWLVCTPQNIVVKRGENHGYSACAYFFGRELHKELKVPIGLISASVGGCPCEPFTPPSGDRWLGMINPLVPFGIRGAIWYQGEGNLGNGMLYHDKMKTLITDWRKAWALGDFPFLFVQVALCKYTDDVEVAPRLWEAQTATLDVPNTGMVVTHDISSYPDCHATNKQEVGRRLAHWALAKTYGKSNIVYSGPIYKSMEVTTGQGPARIRIQFDYTGSGLASRDGKPLDLFTIAGEDKKFVEARAEIDGKSVVVWSDAVAKPVAVRFGWRQDADPNLMNKEGLPAPCFRTDKWEK